MVNDNITIQNMKVKQHTNCKNYEIYAATCNICNDLYIRQTMNNFTKTWNAYRNMKRKTKKN